jgi:hypothetical protein
MKLEVAVQAIAGSMLFVHAVRGAGCMRVQPIVVK